MSLSIPMLFGTRHERLVIIGEGETSSSGERRYVCACDCGKSSLVAGGNLRSGITRSCGCLQRELLARRATKHGCATDDGRTPEYATWQAMWSRTRAHSGKHHRDYVLRGITVCERWKSFELFLADMGPRPSPKHSIDRVDNDGNYELSNCRWATRLEQMNNQGMRRNNTSGIKGVSWNKNARKWQAGICRNRKKIHLGLFGEIAEAAAAIEAARAKLDVGAP